MLVRGAARRRRSRLETRELWRECGFQRSEQVEDEENIKTITSLGR